MLHPVLPEMVRPEWGGGRFQESSSVGHRSGLAHRSRLAHRSGLAPGQVCQKESTAPVENLPGGGGGAQ